jgi:excisionase family DNA binding protein
METKLLFSKREAAQRLSISIRTLENLLATKELEARRIGRRVLIPATVLESFANRARQSQKTKSVTQGKRAETLKSA